MNRMHYSREACPVILASAKRTAKRAEAALDVLLAGVIGVLGAVLLVHWVVS